MCDYHVWGFCLTRTPSEVGLAIFGFSEFLAALALLALIFSISDYLYQFRLMIAAVPVKLVAFCSAALIGFGTLITDIWFAERWYSLPWGVSRASLQGILGATFLITILTLWWIAFLRPPVFSRRNYIHFHRTMMQIIVHGSDSQLAIVASELVRSAKSLVALSAHSPAKTTSTAKLNVAHYAHDVILMMSNRKLCRHIVASSPSTAIAFVEEAVRAERFDLPLGGFLRSITMEALRNRDSILFHEDAFGSDPISLFQPFRKSLYGNYRLISGVGRGLDSPLDLDFRLASDLDGEQFDAYCGIVCTTFEDYIKSKHFSRSSYTLSRALEIIGDAGKDLYKLDGQQIYTGERTPERRMVASVKFINNIVRELDKLTENDLRHFPLRDRGQPIGPDDIFQRIAETIFTLMDSASSVRGPSDNAWWIQYNTFWGRIFSSRKDSPAWRLISFRFRRMVFDNIKELETFPNYQGARLLGFCLNVFGLCEEGPRDRRTGDGALRKAVLRWTKRYYLALHKIHPPVADFCLSGGISFDAEHKRLVKTYSQGLRLEPSREYLTLDGIRRPRRPSTKAN